MIATIWWWISTSPLAKRFRAIYMYAWPVTNRDRLGKIPCELYPKIYLASTCVTVLLEIVETVFYVVVVVVARDPLEKSQEFAKQKGYRAMPSLESSLSTKSRLQLYRYLMIFIENTLRNNFSMLPRAATVASDRTFHWPDYRPKILTRWWAKREWVHLGDKYVITIRDYNICCQIYCHRSFYSTASRQDSSGEGLKSTSAAMVDLSRGKMVTRRKTERTENVFGNTGERCVLDQSLTLLEGWIGSSFTCCAYTTWWSIKI